MAGHTYTVRAEWDEEAATWVAEGEDVPGLVTGADTFEALIDKLRVMVPEMLELNGVLSAADAAAARFTVITHRTERACAVAQVADYTPELKRILRAAGCRCERHGKGDHEIWYSPITGVRFPVDQQIKSRHTANAVLKQAGLPKKF